MIILILSMIFANVFSVEQEWFLPNPLHGSAKNVSKPLMYKKGTVEYKILQLALDIEAVLPTKLYDKEYRAKFMSLIPVPKSMHKNFTERQNLYTDVKMLIKHKYVSEQKGFLVAHGAVTETSRKLINQENTLRKELYSLIASHLKINSTERIKQIPNIYGSAIVNLKYYIMLTREPSSMNNSKALTSMTTSYKFENVLKKLDTFAKKYSYNFRSKNILKNSANIVLEYSKCEDKPVAFNLMLCKVSHSKPICKNKIAKTLLEGLLLNNGVIMWIEQVQNTQTVFLSNDKTEDKDLMFCKGQKFSFFDTFSQYLIKENKHK